MGKLCLIALMREVGLDKFNSMVAEARNQLIAETTWANRGHLEQLFDTQITTLKDRGVPAPIVEMLQNQRVQVIAKASEMAFENGRVPFLPVIPKTYLSIYSQMPMVMKNGKEGFTTLKPTSITDVIDTPDDPYYIYDIEDGEAMRGKTPQNAEKIINKQGRLGLTEVEVIALCVHTDVLLKHNMDIIGSRYNSSDHEIPYIQAPPADSPELYKGYSDIGDHLFGAASCGSRG